MTLDKKQWLIIRMIVFVMILAATQEAQAMHIMEGFLPPKVCLAWGVLCIPFLVIGLAKIQRMVKENPQAMIFLAMAAAFTFVLSALKLPSVAGSSSHMTGLGFAVILFGPSVASVMALIVLLFQALLLAHGGLTTLGANEFSMGIVGPLAAFAVYAGLNKARAPRSVAIFSAAALGDLATYVITSIQLALVYPSESGGVAASFLKFSGIFAVTQVPLAIVEGILTVVLINVIAAYGKEILPSFEKGHMTGKSILVNVGLLLLAVVIVVTPLAMVKDSEFEGADGKASVVIEEMDESFKPWFSSLWEPPGGETESMLFALQAALGSGVIFYCLGYLKGKSRREKS